MSESIRIDSALGGRKMPNPYSAEMRERVIERVESGACNVSLPQHPDDPLPIKNTLSVGIAAIRQVGELLERCPSFCLCSVEQAGVLRCSPSWLFALVPEVVLSAGLAEVMQHHRERAPNGTGQ